MGTEPLQDAPLVSGARIGWWCQGALHWPIPLAPLPSLNVFPENHRGLESSNFYWSKDVEGVCSSCGLANRLAYKPASPFSLKTPAGERRSWGRDTLRGRASCCAQAQPSQDEATRTRPQALAGRLPGRSAREPRLRTGFLLHLSRVKYSGFLNAKGKELRRMFYARYLPGPLAVEQNQTTKQLQPRGDVASAGTREASGRHIRAEMRFPFQLQRERKVLFMFFIDVLKY